MSEVNVGADAGNASVEIVETPEGAERAALKRAAAVEYQKRVLASADEAVDRARAKLAKLEALSVEWIDGARLAIRQANDARDAAVAALEAAQAAAGGED